MSAILEYQKAVYAKLQASAALLAAVQGVYDSVPQNALVPYVYFGDVTAEDATNLGKTSSKISFSILCVTESLGKKQAAEIAEIVRANLHSASLAVTGFLHINTRLVEQKINLASNGTTYFAELEFEAVVSE